MAGNYKNYIKLLQLWPLDKSKAGKDLGQHIRDQVKIAFSKGEVGSVINQDQCDRYYASLQRIVSNYHGQKYTRKLASTATGLTADQCKVVLSPEFQEIIKEHRRSFFTRLRVSLLLMFMRKSK